MAEWQRTKLGEVITLDVHAVPVVSGTSYDIVGVLNRGRGLLIREPLLGEETTYRTLNYIRPDQIVYSRLKAFEGAITVTPSDLGEVYASQEFPTFTCGKRLVPDYFRLLTTTKRLWDQLQSLSTGMGGRRERVKPADFLTIEIALPSLVEQHRIVDVMGAVDTQVEAVAREAASCNRVLSSGCIEMTTPDRIDAATVPVTEVAEILDRMRVPINEAARAGRLGDIPYYGANGQVGWIDQAIFDEPLVLLAEDGGPVEDWQTKPQAYPIDGPAWVNNHAHVLRATQVSRDWLYYSFRHRDLTAVAAGATRPKLTQAGLKTLAVATPADERERVAILRSWDDQARDLAIELASLRDFRDSLLMSLLNREIEIPESYDAHLEKAC